MNKYDVIIIGGGLAGLTAALHLTKENIKVLVLEKQKYPHHKVCGEYVSNEIIPYLDQLGVSLINANAVPINTLQLTTVSGKSIEVPLPLGGVGFSRYAFDHLMYEKAMTVGVDFVFENVKSVAYAHAVFNIFTDQNRQYTAPIAIGAYGKRDGLDKFLNRSFTKLKSEWLGIKAHYEYDALPNNLVSLHAFDGGYAGLSRTETKAVNFCYLVSYESFKKEKNISDFTKKVVAVNPYIKTFINKAQPLFDAPLSIAQISFHQKKSVENHMLMCGDAAGLIHPLCGNGMAMAIHSAKIASELILRFFQEKSFSRAQLEIHYNNQWQAAFKKRLWMGRQLQRLLLNENISRHAMQLITKSPRLLNSIIKMTHGTTVV